jgi:hypothetical protein
MQTKNISVEDMDWDDIEPIIIDYSAFGKPTAHEEGI